MNDAFQKFLTLARTNFWDWQFYAFLLFCALTLAFYLLHQKSILKIDKIFDLPSKFAGKSELWNYLLIGIIQLLLCFLLVLSVGIPVPQTHDEFGFLLAADTFLQGKITNPTPFSPRHFEYFHILVEPVYTAKYPPLQGIFLAAGTAFAGYAIAGVWLSGVLASFAVYWLLRVFFSPRWSLFGACLWIFAPLNILWCDSYWGGHVAIIGGALSIGAVVRLLKSGKRKYLIIWGAGMFILFNSRLYEAALLTGILIILWLWNAFKLKNNGREFYLSLALLCLIFAANLFFTGFYNYKVTGNAFLLPYRLHHSQYHRTPLFVFANPDSPKNKIPPVIEKLDERWLADFQQRYANAPKAFVWILARIPLYIFWLARSPFLIALFIAGIFLSLQKPRSAEWQSVRVILALYMVGLFLTTFTGDRFIAPVVGVFLVVATLCAKIIFRKSKFFGLLTLSTPLVIGSGFLYGLIPVKSDEQAPDITNMGSRSELESFLTVQRGKDLLFLETADAFPADARFYVYNRADIENAEIIYAHKLTAEENAALIGHFRDRKIWLLKNIGNRAVLMKYEGQMENSNFEE